MKYVQRWSPFAIRPARGRSRRQSPRRANPLVTAAYMEMSRNGLDGSTIAGITRRIEQAGVGGIAYCQRAADK